MIKTSVGRELSIQARRNGQNLSCKGRKLDRHVKLMHATNLMHEGRISSAETGEEGSLHFQLLSSFCPSIQFDTEAEHTDSGSRHLLFSFWAARP